MWNNFEPNVKATITFLKSLHVKVNPSTVNETLQNHPDWPSLLCISDSLNNWQVPNAAAKIGNGSIDELKPPFIICIREQETPLAIVKEVTDKSIKVCYKNYRKPTTENKEIFLKKWNGIYLIAEPNEQSGEPDYQKNKRKSFLKALAPIITITLLLLVSLLLIQKTISAARETAPFSIVSIFVQYFIVLAGITVTSLLLWYEVDKNNPALKKFCSGIAKSNCNAILTGKQAKLFSWLSWSELGFFYFSGGFLTLLLAENAAFSIAFTGWMSMLAAPYVFFSLYYQARIAKQWCPLCLMVQLLLISGAVNALAGNFLQPLAFNSIPANLSISLFYVIPGLTWYSIKPYILKLQKGKTTRREYLRIKFNTEIFATLLKNQKSLAAPTDNLGILLGNPDASLELIKVCNPYCGPCSQAHPEIEKLLEHTKNLKVRIIFTATTDEKDKKSLPVKHLLAIAGKNDEGLTRKALDDWYLAEKKDYEAFATKYPLNGELKCQDEKIEAMSLWCKAIEITATPTLFIKGHKLPDAYSIGDLQYFLHPDE